jgi:ABC-type transporter Mla MlaB component
MTSEPSDPVTFAVRGPILRDDLAGLCDRVCALFQRSRAPLVHCHVEGVPADAIAVEALARLQLAARRHGRRVRLCGASRELIALVELMGLSDVLAE